MSKRIFITGATSLFGSAFLNLIPEDFQVIVAQHKMQNQIKGSRIQTVKLDILDKNALFRTVAKYQPNVVIHAAAASNVDYCEVNRAEAWAINVGGTKNVLQAINGIKTHFIYLSSNAVFDGTKEIYEERDTPNPINYYGRTKYEGELLTLRHSKCWTVVRPITMYGWQPVGTRANPVTWVIEALSSGESIKVVDDVFLNPLYNMDLGKLTWEIIKKEAKGIYHLAGPEALNRYKWAIKISDAFDLNRNLITPVPTSYFTGEIAMRPQRTIYSIEKIKREFKYKPKSINEGLNEMKRDMFS